MNATTTSIHKSVLVNEILNFLPEKRPLVVVDGTVNGGGHSLLISEKLNKEDLLIGIDVDSVAINNAKTALSKVNCKIKLINGNFANLDELLKKEKIAKFDFILLDLGWSQNQINDPDRGFSFLVDGPLDMRLDKKSDIPTAKDLVNHLTEADLFTIIKELGEDRFARKIARIIVERRLEKPFTTTLDLADLISKKLPKGKIHPATKTFQALRIAVNNELSTLIAGLEKSFSLLDKNGIMAIISFHSLEDRIVKQFYQEQKSNNLAEILTKKPITASPDELKENPRSRSAKLRILKKI